MKGQMTITESSRQRDQVIVCGARRNFERFYGLVCSEGQIVRICGKLSLWRARALRTTQHRELQSGSWLSVRSANPIDLSSS
jgi:hypothetical protein